MGKGPELPAPKKEGQSRGRDSVGIVRREGGAGFRRHHAGTFPEARAHTRAGCALQRKWAPFRDAFLRAFSVGRLGYSESLRREMHSGP